MKYCLMLLSLWCISCKQDQEEYEILQQDDSLLWQEISDIRQQKDTYSGPPPDCSCPGQEYDGKPLPKSINLQYPYMRPQVLLMDNDYPGSEKDTL